MKFKTPKIISQLESQLHTGYELKIFKGYCAINKQGVEKLIDELYATLPDDVKEARLFLENRDIQVKNNENKKGIYESLRVLEEYLEQSYQFLSHTIVNTKKVDSLMQDITESLPSEIKQAQIADK